MAATYTYGGEFSSDDDFERSEQTEQQAKWKQVNLQARPNQREIEETIETIRNLNPGDDLQLSDDLLAALLDFYQTQRGPIVDSTRKLYKKIVFKVIRGETNNGNTTNDTNNNDNNRKNTDPKLDWAKRQSNNIEVASSDEDEPMPPVSSQSSVEFHAKLNRLALGSHADQSEPMEVDSETSNGQPRTTKIVDISSTDDENEDTESDDDDESAEKRVDVTPLAPSKKHFEPAPKPLASTPMVKASQLKKLTTDQDKDKDSSNVDTAQSKRKPYTRSQRSSAKSEGSTGIRNITKTTATLLADKVNLDNNVLESKPKTSKFKVKYFIILALIVAVIAFSIFYLRSHKFESIKSASDRLLSIKF